MQKEPPAQLVAAFLRLGCTAFGGPAVHVALMREEFVERRKWISAEEFTDLFAAANLIPGPTSTELAIYLGYRLGGSLGLLIAGLCFIVPAALMVGVLAWAYSTYHSLPATQRMLESIEPVVVSVVAFALWQLAKTVFKSVWQTCAGAAIGIAAFFGIPPLPLLFGSGLVFAGSQYKSKDTEGPKLLGFLLATVALIAAFPVVLLALNHPRGPNDGSIFLYFLKLGSVLYGSGYVLLAFLNADLVRGYGWLSSRQILDAVAVGQVTPGPVFTTATFIGYLLRGLSGAVLATIAIFLPSFVFVSATARKLSNFRKAPVTSAFLDGINAAALGLMGAVTVQLAIASLRDWISITLCAVALALLLKKVNSAWLLLGAVAVGAARLLIKV